MTPHDRASFEAALDEYTYGHYDEDRAAVLAIYDALAAELATWKERAEAAEKRAGKAEWEVHRLGHVVEMVGHGPQCDDGEPCERCERDSELRGELESARAERDRLRSALRKIRGFDDTWSHRGHEPSEVGHECRMCWIMRVVDVALDTQEPKP